MPHLLCAPKWGNPLRARCSVQTWQESCSTGHESERSGQEEGRYILRRGSFDFSVCSSCIQNTGSFLLTLSGTFPQMTSKALWIWISRKRTLKRQSIGRTLQFRCPSTSGISSRIYAPIANVKAAFYGGIFIELNHTLMHASDTLTASQRQSLIQPT
jgi:hypothetical protein